MDGNRRLEASLDIRSASMRSLLMRLGEEVRHPGFASQLSAELIAGQIAVELFRYVAAIIDGAAIGGLAPWRLRIIEERLTEQRTAPTLAEFAGLCQLSVRQLTRGLPGAAAAARSGSMWRRANSTTPSGS